MGPRTGLDRCEKSRPAPGFDPRTVQSVASRYTNYATWPTYICITTKKGTLLYISVHAQLFETNFQ